jgi:RHS repeat-associated protein
LPLYRRRPNSRRKNSSPGESGKISSKELDPETGFYYYGARYLDPRTSRWLSGDPALGEYLPQAPVNDEAKKGNGNLPGQGGVFNLVNLHVYHYAGNNPVKYVDPDGRTPVNNISMLTPENIISGIGGGGGAAAIGLIGFGLIAGLAVNIGTGTLSETKPDKTYITYIKLHPDGRVYSGRASGYGSPEQVLAKRDNNHHMKDEEFGPAILDKVGYGETGKLAIRGREQQLIDANGGAQLDNNGTSGNKIRGVSKINPLGLIYHNSATAYFGEELHEYTGFGSRKGVDLE